MLLLVLLIYENYQCGSTLLLGAEFAADTIKRRQLVKYDDAANNSHSVSQLPSRRWGMLCPSSTVVIKIPHEAKTRTIQAIRYQMCYQQWLLVASSSNDKKCVTTVHFVGIGQVYDLMFAIVP